MPGEALQVPRRIAAARHIPGGRPPPARPRLAWAGRASRTSNRENKQESVAHFARITARLLGILGKGFVMKMRKQQYIFQGRRNVRKSEEAIETSISF